MSTKPGATTKPDASKVLCAGRVNVCGYFTDEAVFHGDIGNLVEILGRVNDTAILDNELIHCAKTLSNTAMRTAMPFST